MIDAETWDKVTVNQLASATKVAVDARPSSGLWIELRDEILKLMVVEREKK